jgi:hypothetical protein
MNGAAFGALVTVIFNQPLGIGWVDLREPGSVPSDCDTVPLPERTCKGGGDAGDGCTANAQCDSNVCTANGCGDGAPYGIAGIVAGADAGISCASATDCADTQLCSSGSCVQEPCTLDTDCDQNGAGGTGECGSDGFCCDPNIDPTCAGQT